MEPKQEQTNGFLKKRQEFATQIRRQNRSEIISKRRNISSESHPQNSQSSQSSNITYDIDQRYMQYIKKFHKTKFFIESLPELVKSINDPDILKQHYGAIGIRKIMSSVEEPPIQIIIDSGVVPRLIQLISQEEFPQLQLQCTWSLANVASGSRDQCQSVIDKGAIDLFVKRLRSPHLGIIEQAIWAVGNIASDSSFHRDTIIRKGGIPNLMQIIQNCKCEQLVQSGSWALSNLCRGTPVPNYQIIKDAIFLISKLIQQNRIRENSTYADCCWCICYSFPKAKEDYQRLVTKEFVGQVCGRLRCVELMVVVPVVRILGHITKISNYFVDLVLEVDDVVDALYELLYFQKKTVRMETLWVISNIASGHQRHINMLLAHQQLIVKILQLFQSDSQQVRRQICCIFSNMTLDGNPEQISKFFKQTNIIKYYILALSSDDPKLVIDSLDNLYSILELGQKVKQTNSQNIFVNDLANLGALSLIQQLQFHDQQQVYNSVVKIMKEFFQMEDNNDF